jgi:hypothetical protein
MSDMALTLAQSKRNNVTGTKVTSYVTVTFDNSYPTGGELFDATAYVGTPDEVRIASDSALGYIVRYDATNKKLKVFESGNAVNDQTPTADLTLNVLQSPLAEVANTTDLSALAVDLIISGGRA